MERKGEDGRLADPLAQTMRNDFTALTHKFFVAFELLIGADPWGLQYHQGVDHIRPCSLSFMTNVTFLERSQGPQMAQCCRLAWMGNAAPATCPPVFRLSRELSEFRDIPIPFVIAGRQSRLPMGRADGGGRAGAANATSCRMGHRD